MGDPRELSSGENIYARLLAVAAETFGVSLQEISLNANAGMLEQWDSFGHLTLFMAIEEKMNVKFLAEEIIALTSLEEISKAITRKESKPIR